MNKTPIYVDLDGTLIHTDSLYESLLGFVKIYPWMLLWLPVWLLTGRAFFKSKVADYFIPNPRYFPFNNEVVAYLESEKAKGRKIVLATASNIKIASSVADYLGLFEGVIASSESVNLKGKEKCKAIENDCAGGRFVYAGDALIDMQIWRQASAAIVVDKESSLTHRLQGEQVLIEKQFNAPAFSIWNLLKAIRLPHSSKNLLVFVSLVLSHQFFETILLRRSIVAFFSFCLCAAGLYIINDCFDLDSDRQHHSKQYRPFAAGLISIKFGAFFSFFLLSLGVLGGWSLSANFVVVLLIYCFFSFLYSFWLKRIALLDVIVLALLYTVRIIAGSKAIGIATTPWLLGFSIFIFLSLAFVKRYSELRRVKLVEMNHVAHGRGYHVEDVDQLAIFGIVSGYISVLVLALYANSSQVAEIYDKVHLLWLVCPVLIFWISRIWMLARRGCLHEDPVVFTLKDKVSYVVGGVVGILLYLAA